MRRLRPFYAAALAHWLGSYAFVFLDILIDEKSRHALARADGGDVLTLILIPLLSWYQLLEAATRYAVAPARSAMIWTTYLVVFTAVFLLTKRKASPLTGVPLTTP